MKSGFFDRLIDRLDRVDPKSLQVHFLRLAQERGLLETIFQSIQEGVIVINGTGKLTYANRAAENLIGFSMETANGRPVSRYLREIDWERVLQLDTAEWSKLISQEIEVTYPEHRFLNLYVVPLSFSQQDETGAVIILRDVMDQRRQEADMLETERLNAVKLLAAGVAHEIGNPLNALNIHLQLLEREIRNLSEDHRKNLEELAEIARTEVSRLDLIITQFLRAVRPSRPKLVLSRVEELLKETLSLLRQEVQDRKIHVELDCPESLPKIRLDRNQIKQAFFNIIRNALQAMPDGGALRISLSFSDRFLAVTFQDTGVGIKREDFGRIFEPYYTTKPSGSGLGLMIVQRIVQDHGGQIEVLSKQDTGTHITVLLPLAERRIRLLKAHASPAGKSGKRS